MRQSGYGGRLRAAVRWAVALSLCASPGMASTQEIPLAWGHPVRGRDLLVERGCLSCHAVRGSGGKVGPDLAAALVRKGTTGIAATMLTHYPKMSAAVREGKVALPRLSPAEMDDMVAYLLFINFAHEPGSAARGRTLFSKKGCIKCHGFTPGGVAIAPPLGRASLATTPISIAQEMWNHGAQMNAIMRQVDVQRPVFKGHEMADLLAFLGGEIKPFAGHETALPGDPVAGRTLYQEKGCARCHLEGIGPDLSKGGWYMTATEIAGEMWNHGPPMWARMERLGITVPRFKDNEMADVIAYLYLLRSTNQPGDPVRGRHVFDEKHCGHCHQPGGAGPDLTTVPQLDTPIHFAATMWNHAPRMQKFLRDAGIPWPTFTASDVNDLVAFVGQERGAAAK
ncbi:MAG: c-type cytochrome [Candidatus Binatia bacterium]